MAYLDSTPLTIAAAVPAEGADSDDALSGASSPLSCLSRTPSPPLPALPQSYLSPPSSQASSIGSPNPDCDDSVSMSLDDDESRPRKRRRKTPEPISRETQYLDLQNLPQNPAECQQLQRLLHFLRKKRKIVIIAGAGISTSAGVPDFRTSNGLFNSLKAEHKLKASGKQLFDASVYNDDTATTSFHAMVRSLSQTVKDALPTAFHHLVARLAHENRLLRLYSQNVDGIDTALPPLATEVPLANKSPWPKTIQLHGGLEKMICTKCHALSDFQPELFDGPVPPACGACVDRDHVRELASKRSHGIGRLRPRMVLYNEHNPDSDAIGAVTQADLKARPDAVIVVGTTLKVPGVKAIAREMCKVVKDRKHGLTVWINRDTDPPLLFEECWDMVVKGTSDEVADLVGLGKWDDEGDDTGPYRQVSEDEQSQSKERAGEVQIILPPLTKDHFSNLIPTPIDTPIETPIMSPVPSSKTSLHGSDTPRKANLKIQCSSFSQLLQMGLERKPNKPKTVRSKKSIEGKPTTAKRKTNVNGTVSVKAPRPKKTKDTVGGGNIGKSFKVSKPNTLESTKESLLCTPGKYNLSEAVPMNKLSPMEPIPDANERLNKSPLQFAPSVLQI